MKDYLAGLLTMVLLGMVLGGAIVLFGFLIGMRGSGLKMTVIGASLLVFLYGAGFTVEWFTPGSHFRSLFHKAGPKR